MRRSLSHIDKLLMQLVLSNSDIHKNEANIDNKWIS